MPTTVLARKVASALGRELGDPQADRLGMLLHYFFGADDPGERHRESDAVEACRIEAPLAGEAGGRPGADEQAEGDREAVPGDRDGADPDRRVDADRDGGECGQRVLSVMALLQLCRGATLLHDCRSP